MPYFSTEQKENITIIRFAFNEIGFQGREELKKDLHVLLSDEAGKYVLNLGKIGFLSTLAVSILIFFSKAVETRDGQIKLCCLTDEAKEVLKITHLDSVFEICETEEDAMKEMCQ